MPLADALADALGVPVPLADALGVSVGDPVLRGATGRPASGPPAAAATPTPAPPIAAAASAAVHVLRASPTVDLPVVSVVSFSTGTTLRRRPPSGPQPNLNSAINLGPAGRLCRVSSDCVFCRIVAGIAPASVVHADETSVAFLDISPVTPGHLLVVPRVHAPGLADLDPEVGARLFQVAQRLAAGLRRSGVRCDGVNLFLADGAAAFQEVFHVHLHVLPRWRGDGFKLVYKAGAPSRAELDERARDIRAGLDRLALPD